MIRLALNWWSYHNSLLIGDLTHEAMIRRGAELGAQGIAIEYFALPRAWRDEPIKLLQLQSEFRLEYCLGFGVPLAVPETLWLALAAERKRFWRLALRLGVRTIGTIPVFFFPFPSLAPLHAGYNLTGRFRMRRAVSRLREFCDQAAVHDITVTVANHGAIGIRRLMWLLEKVERKNLRVALNTGQALAQREDPYRLVDRFAPEAATVLLQDRLGVGPLSRGRAIGDGQIDFEEILRLLARHRFTGLCTVDVDLPLWAGKREDDWVGKSFARLVRLRAKVMREFGE